MDTDIPPQKPLSNTTTKPRSSRSKPSIRVQSVIYQMSADAIARSLIYLDNAARMAARQGVSADVSVAFGDCSPTVTLDDDTLSDFRSRFPHLSAIDYTFFAANLGSAAGHNRLSEAADSDLLVIQNPDVLVAPAIFGEMTRALSRSGVGQVEARQLPVEHPKFYDAVTGETSWASTACAMVPLRLFRSLSGFDADTFFLYGDDVDFSWRVRLAGHTVVHQCSAVVFHDKRLGARGNWLSASAERYYSAECGLLLPYKFSRPELTRSILADFKTSGDDSLIRAADAFELRRKTGRLPTPLDPNRQVAEFDNGAYAQHRFQAT